MQSIKSKTIMFITGAFVTNKGWDDWCKYFENAGYTTIAPAWPYKDDTVENLRALHPTGNQGLSHLTFKELVDHHVRIAESLPEKPIVIGHSTGGLLAQILLNRDLAEACVAIHSLPPKGVTPTQLSFYRGGGLSLGIGTSTKKTYMMSFKKWQYAFVNGMSLEDQMNAYKDNTIPESKTMARGALTNASKVDFKKKHGPLLFTSGSTDNIIPAGLNKKNYAKYAQDNGSITEYKDFPGRNHFVLGLPTWTEDADYILEWLSKK